MEGRKDGWVEGRVEKPGYGLLTAIKNRLRITNNVMKMMKIVVFDLTV